MLNLKNCLRFSDEIFYGCSMHIELQNYEWNFIFNLKVCFKKTERLKPFQNIFVQFVRDRDFMLLWTTCIMFILISIKVGCNGEITCKVNFIFYQLAVFVSNSAFLEYLFLEQNFVNAYVTVAVFNNPLTIGFCQHFFSSL